MARHFRLKSPGTLLEDRSLIRWNARRLGLLMAARRSSAQRARVQSQQQSTEPTRLMQEASADTEASSSGEFDPEQKRYLEGFMSGLQIGRAARALPAPAAGPAGSPALEPTGPDAPHLRAQERVIKAGKKLSDPE